MSPLYFVGTLDFMDDAPLGIEVINLDAFYLKFLVAFRPLRIARLMNALTVIDGIAGVFHIDAAGEKPQFAMANLVVAEVGARGSHVLIASCSLLHFQGHPATSSPPRQPGWHRMPCAWSQT